MSSKISKTSEIKEFLKNSVSLRMWAARELALKLCDGKQGFRWVQSEGKGIFITMDKRVLIFRDYFEDGSSDLIVSASNKHAKETNIMLITDENWRDTFTKFMIAFIAVPMPKLILTPEQKAERDDWIIEQIKKKAGSKHK